MPFFPHLRYYITGIFERIMNPPPPADLDNFLFRRATTATEKSRTPGISLPISDEFLTAQKMFLEIEDAYVTQIKWCKEVEFPFHEFCVVKVHQDKTNKVQYMTFERTIDPRVKLARTEPETSVGDPLPQVDIDIIEPQSATKQQEAYSKYQSSFLKTSPKSISVASSWTSASSTPSQISLDIIHFSPDGAEAFIYTRPKPHNCHRTLSVNMGVLSIQEFFTLCVATHEYHQNYDLLEFQCYWFCNVIYTLIKKLCREENWSESCNDERKLSKFGGIIVKMGKRGSTEGVERMYNKIWVEVKSRIEELRAEDRRKEAELANAKAEAAAAKAGEKRKDAELANAKAEAADAKAEATAAKVGEKRKDAELVNAKAEAADAKAEAMAAKAEAAAALERLRIYEEISTASTDPSISKVGVVQA